MIILGIFISLIIGFVLVAFILNRLFLVGEDLRQYDQPSDISFEVDPEAPPLKLVQTYLYETLVRPTKETGWNDVSIEVRRDRFEEPAKTRHFDVSFKPDEIKWEGVSVPGEWVLAPNYDPDHRLLYIHGGAFIVGSALAYRPITAQLAQKTGCAVFAVNYRLMPEHARMDMVKDCRAAYQWIWEHGPDGPSRAKALAYGGDSAGGNLALMLSNWIREKQLDRPQAVFTLSPLTDATLSGPSIRQNFETDMMLKPVLAPLLKLPPFMLSWVTWLMYKLPLNSPIMSPIMADLSDLPPTLIQVSSAEMLYDDARRYGVKAQRAGSAVTVQSWSYLPHIWPMFDVYLPEAGQAMDEIAVFLASHGVSGQQRKEPS